MNRIKSIIIYGAIIVLVIAAFGGYFISKTMNRADTATADTTVTAAGTAAAAASTESTTVPSTSATKAKAAPKPEVVMLKDGNNITGKSEEERQDHVKLVMKKSTEKLEPNPVVGIGRGTDFAKTTSDAVANAGGLEGVIKEGDVVLIKPNLCVQSEDFGSPMTTDYRVVQQLVDMAKNCGASRVVVAEGNFGANAFTNTENRYAELKGAELFNFNDCEESDCYSLKAENSLVGKEIFIPRIYMDADVVITAAKLKTHFITTVSLGLKNGFGVPSYKIYGAGGDKTGLHQLGVEEAILDINKIRKPDFTVVDGIIGGENYGPYANTPVESNIVLAGRDIVAVDTVGLTFMGFSLDDISHVKRAGEEKLGISDLSKIKVEGADLNSIIMHFEPAN